MDPHAQYEIRVFAEAMYELLKPIVPISCEAFEDYRLGAMHLTKLEIESIKSGSPLATTNKRELAEFETKCAQLGISMPGAGAIPATKTSG
jgi:thymidylate synthase (FAD)